jgi:hypothetical protein
VGLSESNASKRLVAVGRSHVLGRDKTGQPVERRSYVLRVWRLVIEAHWS